MVSTNIQKGDHWVWNDITWDSLKEEGVHGHPQAYYFASFCAILTSHHIVSHISNKEMLSAPLYSNAYKTVSSPNKWYNCFNRNANLVIIGHHFIQGANIYIYIYIYI